MDAAAGAAAGAVRQLLGAGWPQSRDAARHRRRLQSGSAAAAHTHKTTSSSTGCNNALDQFYNGSGVPPMTFTRILIANWDSDVSGVMAHIYPHTRCLLPASALQNCDFSHRLSLNASRMEWRRHARQQLHCSAAVQVAPDLSDVCVQHQLASSALEQLTTAPTATLLTTRGRPITA